MENHPGAHHLEIRRISGQPVFQFAPLMTARTGFKSPIAAEVMLHVVDLRRRNFIYAAYADRAHLLSMADVHGAGFLAITQTPVPIGGRTDFVKTPSE